MPLLPIANAMEPNAPNGANFMITSTNLKKHSDMRVRPPSTLARVSFFSISKAAPKPIEITSTCSSEPFAKAPTKLSGKSVSRKCSNEVGPLLPYCACADAAASVFGVRCMPLPTPDRFAMTMLMASAMLETISK